MKTTRPAKRTNPAIINPYSSDYVKAIKNKYSKGWYKKVVSNPLTKEELKKKRREYLHSFNAKRVAANPDYHKQVYERNKERCLQKHGIPLSLYRHYQEKKRMLGKYYGKEYTLSQFLSHYSGRIQYENPLVGEK